MASKTLLLLARSLAEYAALRRLCTTVQACLGLVHLRRLTAQCVDTDPSAAAACDATLHTVPWVCLSELSVGVLCKHRGLEPQTGMLGVLLFHVMHLAIVADTSRRRVFLASGYLWVYGVACLAHTVLYAFLPHRCAHNATNAPLWRGCHNQRLPVALCLPAPLIRKQMPPSWPAATCGSAGWRASRTVCSTPSCPSSTEVPHRTWSILASLT